VTVVVFHTICNLSLQITPLLVLHTVCNIKIYSLPV